MQKVGKSTWLLDAILQKKDCLSLSHRPMRYKVIHILDSCHFNAKVCHHRLDHEHINAKF